MGWIGGPLELRTHPLPPPGLACVMQDLKLLSFNVQWFRDLGASFSSFGCFFFESWVLCFRVLGASFSRFESFIFEIWVLRASVFVFECFVFKTTMLLMLYHHSWWYFDWVFKDVDLRMWILCAGLSFLNVFFVLNTKFVVNYNKCKTNMIFFKRWSFPYTSLDYLWHYDNWSS